MVEEQIINLFCKDRNLFTKYYKYVNINYIKINYSNIYKLFIVIEYYYNKYNNNNNITKEELKKKLQGCKFSSNGEFLGKIKSIKYVLLDFFNIFKLLIILLKILSVLFSSKLIHPK